MSMSRTAPPITLHPEPPAPGTWAPMCRASRAFSCPTSAGWTAYRRWRATRSWTAQGYLGFARMTGPGGVQCNGDGVVRRMQPDVSPSWSLLEAMAETMGLPPSGDPEPVAGRACPDGLGRRGPAPPEPRGRRGHRREGDAWRARVQAAVSPVPPGGARRRARTRWWCYFHGGGWVRGDLDSDDPLCRDLCVRSGTVVVSVNYRHAPEARFPAAAQDACAALRWVDANATELGGIPGQLAVAGWSAGGNIAAVACQQARDDGGPDISGQLLISPVVDSQMSRPSYTENGDGYILTSALMRWFWDHYADPADRGDPRAAPLLGSLERLPPACIVRCGLRSASRRGRRLCPRPGGRRGASPPRPGPRAHPHVGDHGRRGHLRRTGPRGDGMRRSGAFSPHPPRSSRPRARAPDQSARVLPGPGRPGFRPPGPAILHRTSRDA